MAVPFGVQNTIVPAMLCKSLRLTSDLKRDNHLLGNYVSRSCAARLQFMFRFVPFVVFLWRETHVEE